MTGGIWLFAIPFYQKRCPICWTNQLSLTRREVDENGFNANKPAAAQIFGLIYGHHREERISQMSFRKSTVLFMLFSCLAWTSSPWPASFHTDNIEAVVQQLKELKTVTKSESETQSQFEARGQYSFPCGEHCDTGFEYDAENAVMRLHISVVNDCFWPNGSQWYGGTTETDQPTIPLEHFTERKDRYVGQTLSGAVVPYVSTLERVFGVVLTNRDEWLDKSLYALHYPVPRTLADSASYDALDSPELRLLVSTSSCVGRDGGSLPRYRFFDGYFQLSVERARRMKPNLRVVLVGALSDPRVYVGEGESTRATFHHPVKRDIRTSYVKFSLNEIRVVDAASGAVVANFTSQQEKRAEAAREEKRHVTRHNPFP
jgi:hypothetical protein